jgi:subtilisin family serine protease
MRSTPFIRTLLTCALSVAIASVALFGGVVAAAPESGAQKATQDSSSALVQLNTEPLATYSKTKPPQGKKIDFSSNDVKSYRAQLSALRNDYKAWLRANVPNAKVTQEFDLSLNAVVVELNGATLAQVAAAPMVKRAEYQGLYRPTVTDPDLALIRAPQAWVQGGGAANAGQGVKVAILDTGIDITHPCFSDAGYPSATKIGDPSLTNNKVIAAKVFYNKAKSRGLSAEALQSHGTHVAGTAACNFDTPAPVNGVATYNMSGVAPRALLGNYNIFPGDVDNARSEDILNALDAAYEDGFDIANMSLGGNAHGIQDLVTIAVDNLDQANMVVAVAAGNAGPGLFTVESPGSAARALTAGASTVGHLLAAPVTVGGSTYPARPGDFATVAADLTAPLAVVTGPIGGLGDACAALPAGSLTGRIALVSRGNCFFTVKVRNTQAAGAAAVLIANNAFGDPIVMGGDGTPDQPTLPAYMVSRDDGQTLKGFNGASTTIGAALVYFQTPNSDIMADFSGQGPTDVDFRVKPDVVAPGANVISSFPHQFCASPPCFEFLDGTSMATPHLAGSAAVVRQQHPTWSAADVRSAIVNTADRGVLKSFNGNGALSNDVNVNGSGRENLLAAVNARVALDPVSVSFGAVPSGSGQVKTFDVTLRNVSGSAMTLSVAVGAGDASVAYAVSPGSVTLAAGATTVVTVTMTAGRGAAAGGHQAWLELTSGGAPVAHAAVYTLIK